MHEFIEVNVVDCEYELIENIESEFLGDDFVLLEEVEGVLALEVLSDDIIVGVVLEHFVHFNDIGMVLGKNELTICCKI